MLLDILVLIWIIYGALKGFRNGLIETSIGLISYILCFFIAFYFNHKVTAILYEIELLQNVLLILPILSFVIIFFVTNKLINILSKVLKKINQILLLGIFDKLGGAILETLLHVLIISLILYFGFRFNIIPNAWKANSIVSNNFINIGELIINFLIEHFEYIKSYSIQLFKLLKHKEQY